MALSPERNLKMTLAVLGALLASAAGGWVWTWRRAATIEGEIARVRKEVSETDVKSRQIHEQIGAFERSGARAFYYRMLPDAGDLLHVPTLRILADIEEEAGVHIIDGVHLTKTRERTGALAKQPFLEEKITVKIRADYRGLIRFVEGLEREADRPGEEGGGRLFEVKELKTFLSAVEDTASPEWREIYMQDTERLGPKRTFELVVAVFTMKS